MNMILPSDGNRFVDAHNLTVRCAELLSSHAKRLRELASVPVMSDCYELVGLAREAEIAASQCELGHSILRTLPHHSASLLLFLARRVGKLQSVEALSKSMELPVEEVWAHACALEAELARYDLSGELIVSRECGLTISAALSRTILGLNTKRSGDEALVRRIHEKLAIEGPRTLAHILLLLLQAGGQEVHQDVIAKDVGISVSSVKVFVSRLRRELDRLGLTRVLTTRYRHGYILDEDAAAELRKRIGLSPSDNAVEPTQN